MTKQMIDYNKLELELKVMSYKFESIAKELRAQDPSRSNTLYRLYNEIEHFCDELETRREF